jgi:hypothetical protein
MATIPQDDPLHDSRPVGGWLPVVLFGLIAVLMAADVTIDLQRGGATAVESFEALIFASALAGIAFYWRQRVTERRRSQHLDLELAAARPKCAAGRPTRSAGTRKLRKCCRVWARPSIGSSTVGP